MSSAELQTAIDNANQAMQQVTEVAVYLMGAGFALGSLTTILALLMLDWLRKGQEESLRKNKGDHAL